MSVKWKQHGISMESDKEWSNFLRQLSEAQLPQDLSRHLIGHDLRLSIKDEMVADLKHEPTPGPRPRVRVTEGRLIPGGRADVSIAFQQKALQNLNSSGTVAGPFGGWLSNPFGL